MTLVDVLSSEELPKVDVTKEAFRERATAAGWQVKTIDLFLRPGKGVVREHVKVGGEWLRVVDW